MIQILLEDIMNTEDKLQYESPKIERLGKLSQLIQGDSGNFKDMGPDGSALPEEDDE